jgi:hypothetical protein
VLGHTGTQELVTKFATETKLELSRPRGGCLTGVPYAKESGRLLFFPKRARPECYARFTSTTCASLLSLPFVKPNLGFRL